MGKTKIEWTEHTWSPVTGCSHAGTPGCDMCYARRMARRLAGRYGYPEYPYHFDVTLRPERLEIPLRRKKPTMYFVCSMSDLFHDDVPFEFIDKVFAVMALCPQHTFQILTKRPRRMCEYLHHYENVEHELTTNPNLLWRAAQLFGGSPVRFCDLVGGEGMASSDYMVELDSPPSFPLDNVWLGTSVENQPTADARREYLRECPAAVKFVSYEPALGAIDWTGWEFVDQIISGGESGPGARPSHPDWHRGARDFCQANEIAYFFKQAKIDGKMIKLPELDGRQWKEFPDAIQRPRETQRKFTEAPKKETY